MQYSHKAATTQFGTILVSLALPLSMGIMATSGRFHTAAAVLMHKISLVTTKVVSNFKISRR